MRRIEIPKEIVAQYYMSTGIEEMDELFLGYPLGKITLVTGNFKVGKTTLAMMAALRVASEGREVIYVDTENRFGSLRAVMLGEAMKRKGILRSFDGPATISKIRVYQPKSLDDQHKLMMNEVCARVRDSDVGMVVLDSLSFYYHQQVVNAPSEHAASVARTLIGRLETHTKRVLHEVARKNIPFLVTTWSASSAKWALESWTRRKLIQGITQGTLEPGDIMRYVDALVGQPGSDFIGGQWIGYIAHVILRVFRTGLDSRYLYLTSHTEVPDGYGLRMRMTDAGLLPEEGAKPEPVTARALQEIMVAEEKELEREKAMEAGEVPQEAAQEGGRGAGRRSRGSQKGSGVRTP